MAIENTTCQNKKLKVIDLNRLKSLISINVSTAFTRERIFMFFLLDKYIYFLNSLKDCIFIVNYNTIKFPFFFHSFRENKRFISGCYPKK
jgi:hypothetical protein